MIKPTSSLFALGARGGHERIFQVAVSALLAVATAASASPPWFFPPDPPPLGAPAAVRDTAPEGSPAAPPELAVYVSESFYVPLAARLTAPNQEGKLTDALRARLDAYHATKVALQTEILAHFDMLRETDLAGRQAAIEQFSREQTPRVAALEEAAEALRRDLVGSGPKDVPLPESGSGLLRFASVYREGLCPAQRRLLREAALEMDDAAKVAAVAGGPWFFFSPEGSRVRLPANLPPTLTSKIAAYKAQRRALVAELSVAMGDPVGDSLAKQAARQGPRLAELEALAEDIRRGLAVLRDPGRRPDLPPLSPELEARVAAYRSEKLDLQKALLAKVEEITNRRSVGEKPASNSAATEELQEKIREAIAAFTRQNAARYAALEQNKESIRNALAHLENSTGVPAGVPTVDALLKKFSEALAQWEVWRDYHDYQIAVLQPGLSPEERRLLFATALEKLAVPLPAGTESWR